jgi:hypothetical protein
LAECVHRVTDNLFINRFRIHTSTKQLLNGADYLCATTVIEGNVQVEGTMTGRFLNDSLHRQAIQHWEF